MQTIILDASLVASWTLPDEISPASKKLRHALEGEEYQMVTIPLFFYEFRNILVTNHMRGKIQKIHIDVFLQDMRNMDMTVEKIENDVLIMQLALQHKLSAYDAAYLALAVQEKAIMATNDKKLLQAAIAQGLEYRTTLVHGSYEI